MKRMNKTNATNATKTKRQGRYFGGFEIGLWGTSVLLIAVAFFLFDRKNGLTLLASMIGVTSLLFNAKGNPIGQALMIVFSLLYGVISWRFSYYGEMLTYLGMTLPMSVFALVTWLRNPYGNNHAEVKVNRISRCEVLWMCVAAIVVTAGFGVLLAYFETANLIPSTVSVTTSFLAVYLTFRRSPWFALAYAANDVVLILLWSLASATDLRYVAVAVCFFAFLCNDLYGFFSWNRRLRRQSKDAIY